MNVKLSKSILALIFLGVIFLGTVQSKDAVVSKDMPEKKSEMMKEGMGGMMGKMDMNKMMGMMNDCMEMHKNGKMCDNDMMGKCQGSMSKKECKMMIKKAKYEIKEKKDNIKY